MKETTPKRIGVVFTWSAKYMSGEYGLFDVLSHKKRHINFGALTFPKIKKINQNYQQKKIAIRIEEPFHRICSH